MALCRCDGPPHTYDPAWCIGGIVPVDGVGLPMQPARPTGRDTLRPRRGSDRDLRLAAVRRLDDGTEGARIALRVLGVTEEELR